MSRIKRIVRGLFGRSLWVAVLFLLLSLISLVNPSLMRAPTDAEAEGKDQVRRSGDHGDTFGAPIELP